VVRLIALWLVIASQTHTQTHTNKQARASTWVHVYVGTCTIPHNPACTHACARTHTH